MGCRKPFVGVQEERPTVPCGSFMIYAGPAHSIVPTTAKDFQNIVYCLHLFHWAIIYKKTTIIQQ